MKTTREIIDDWDTYKNTKIDFKEDWAKEHYLKFQEFNYLKNESEIKVMTK